MKSRVDVASVFDRARSVYNLIQTMIIEVPTGTIKEFQGIIFETKKDRIELYFEKEKIQVEVPKLVEQIIMNLPSEDEKIEELVLEGFDNGEDVSFEPDNEKFISLSDLRLAVENYNLEVEIFESNLKRKLTENLEIYATFITISIVLFWLVGWVADNGLILVLMFSIPTVIFLISILSLIYRSFNFYWSAGSEGFECDFCDLYGVTTDSFRSQKLFYDSFNQRPFKIPNFFERKSKLTKFFID
jgi:hypothetical protein